jgi:hypothetical protein
LPAAKYQLQRAIKRTELIVRLLFCVLQASSISQAARELKREDGLPQSSLLNCLGGVQPSELCKGYPESKTKNAKKNKTSARCTRGRRWGSVSS